MGSDITQEQLRAIGPQIIRHYWRDKDEDHGSFQSIVYRETRRENRRASRQND